MDFLTLSVPAILLYSVAAAAVLIYLPFMVVGYARFSVGYDMSAPRAMFERLPSYAQRATWAHQNSFEAFMIFAAAALMAYVTNVDSIWAEYAAITFLVARSLYSIFYILNVPLLRSLMYAVGSTCSATLIVLSIIQASN